MPKFHLTFLMCAAHFFPGGRIIAILCKIIHRTAKFGHANNKIGYMFVILS